MVHDSSESRASRSARTRTTTRNYDEIGPGYFRTLGIPLIAGREFTRADSLKAPKVAIVNERSPKKFNLGRDAVGKRMSKERPRARHRDRRPGEGREVTPA